MGRPPQRHPTKQADPDGPTAVPFDVGADLDLQPSGRHGPVLVNDPVLADVAPAALLDMPALAIRDLPDERGRPAIQPWPMQSGRRQVVRRDIA